MREFRVGDKATWHGRKCTVMDRAIGKLGDPRLPAVRLRWESGTRNGKPRARYDWVPESRCVLVESPTAAQEASSVGRRGQWSERQDVTEAAARVTAKAAEPAVRAGWERKPSPWSHIDLLDYMQHVSGCAVAHFKRTGRTPSTWVPYSPNSGSDLGEFAIVNPFVERNLDAAMDAAEAWWAKQKPAAPEPDPDALPVGWECRGMFLATDRLYHIASGAMIDRWAGWWRGICGGAYIIERTKDRAAAIAACEAWLAARATTATTAPAPKPAPCAGCAALDHERTILQAALDTAQSERDETERVLSLSHAALTSACVPPCASLPMRIAMLVEDADKAEWVIRDANAALANAGAHSSCGTLARIAWLTGQRDSYKRASDEARKAVGAAAADRVHLLAELKRETEKVNAAHDALDAAGVAVDVSAALRIAMLANERDDRMLDVAALKRAAETTWRNVVARVVIGLAFSALGAGVAVALEWWLR